MRESVRFPCPCCGYLTLSEKPPGTYEVCPVCFWEDDSAQTEGSTLEGGANTVSLVQARKNFAAFGAAAWEHRTEVRKPQPEEMPAPN